MHTQQQAKVFNNASLSSFARIRVRVRVRIMLGKHLVQIEVLIKVRIGFGFTASLSSRHHYALTFQQAGQDGEGGLAASRKRK